MDEGKRGGRGAEKDDAGLDVAVGGGAGGLGRPVASPVNRRVQDEAGAADARQAIIVGFGSVAAGVATSLVWSILLSAFGADNGWGEFDARSLVEALAWFALPCALIASMLAWVSLRRSRGVRSDGRILSIVLWTVLSPVVWGLCATLWFLLVSSSPTGSVVFGGGAAAVGTGVWCASLVPAWVVLLSWRFLRRHPATKPDGGPVLTGRAEHDGDAEVGAAF